MSEGLWSPFSTPSGAASPALLSALTNPWARGVVTTFLERRRASLPEDLASLLERWALRPEDGAFVWHPSLGLLRASAASGAPAPVDCAALACAYLLATGMEGEFDVELSVPQSLLWGRLVLPRGRRVQATVTANGAEIEIDPGSSASVRVSLAREGAGTSDTSQQAPGADGITLLGRDSISEEIWQKLDAFREAPVAELAERTNKAFAEAAALLRRVAPDYLDWVRRTITAVGVINGEAHRVLSGSNKDIPGLVGISYPAHPAEIAEMFIHEASHQYFYLVTRAADVDDGTDQTVYWSSAARAERGLDRILLAYHAFANVLLFYNRCRELGLDEPVIFENQEHIGRIVGELDSGLRRTNALTALGRGLYRPLAARLSGERAPEG